jgi:hypothetical protein
VPVQDDGIFESGKRGLVNFGGIAVELGFYEFLTTMSCVVLSICCKR